MRIRRSKQTRRKRGGALSFDAISVLVTGGAGFIGSNLVDALLAAGAQVHVLDNLETGSLANLELARKSDRFTFIEGDIRDPVACAEACKGIQIVYHEAALVSVPISMKDPMKNHEINITGTLNMLQAAATAGVRRFVYASSAATYGSLEELPKREELPRHYPSPYALSKGVDEDYAGLWASNKDLGGGMTCVGLRYFNVYGPRQDPNSPYSGVISRFTDRVKKGEPVTFFGQGEQTRDFVFVADVVQANLLAGLATLKEPSRIYNVGTGRSVSLLEMKETLERILDRTIPHQFAEYRAGDILHSASTIDRIQSELGYSPRFTLEQGLTQLLQSIGMV